MSAKYLPRVECPVSVPPLAPTRFLLSGRRAENSQSASIAPRWFCRRTPVPRPSSTQLLPPAGAAVPAAVAAPQEREGTIATAHPASSFHRVIRCSYRPHLLPVHSRFLVN